MTQTRVGTTLLGTLADSADKDKPGIDEDAVKDLATMLAKRARQAQDGNAPSAALDG
ncbi:hypothetical protein [Streptomyces sp. NPDC014793]|uniref:hypothetical protein n=1 Tax=Streptomyces sp. NPDC014793 TaxID=3364914 RepID=UPI0036FFCCE9